MREYRAIRSARPARADSYPDAFDTDRFAVVRSLMVFEPDEDWRDSGLVDASGTPLMRRDRLGPIGFITPRDA